MASTYTTSNSLEKPALGDYKNTWGTEVNVNWDCIDDMMDGSVSKSATATLTTTQGAVNEARNRMIIYTGSSVGTITIPAVEKWYFVRNSGTARCIITAGGTTVTVGEGLDAIVYCDGTNCSFMSGRRRWAELLSQATTSGTSKTFGGASVDLEHYSELLFQINGVSHSGGAASDFRIGIGATFYVLGNFAAAATVYGALKTESAVTDNLTDTNFGGFFAGAVADLSAEGLAASATAACIPFRIADAGGVPDIIFDFNGATLDAGSIVMYGR